MAKNPWALPDGFDESTKEALRDLFGALRRSRTHITPEALNALKMGNLAAFSALVDWSSIRSEFSNFKTILSAQARRAALEIYKAGGVGSQLTFDLINERAVEYAMQRAGELVVSIEDEMRETIRDIITRSTQGEFTVQQAGKFIRANLPLTPRDSNAVLNYADRQYFRFIRDGYSDLKARIKADAMAERYADKLTRQRATTIARTETAKASMEGVLAGWRSGVETGLIENTSQKEWIAEADACEICGPMDGKLVAWDAPFASGVMTPPQHPNCRCSMAILPPDYTDTPFTGQVYNGNKVKVEFEYGNQIRKHLSGQHDQATHGKGGGQIPIGMANWVDKVDDIKSAASGLDESLGNRHLAVVLERAGMSEKPTIVGSVEELSGKPMYRGVTDPAHAEQFINAPVAYQPDGQYGNGTYFADDFNEAKLYSENKTGGFTRTDFADAVVKPTVITAGWKKDAKVLSFRDEREFLDYKNKLYDKWTKATKMPAIKMTRIGSKTLPARPQDQSPRWNAWKEKFVDNFANRASNVSTLFAMDGVDGYRINTIKEAIRPFREVPLGYTVVLNRGALEVVQP